MYVRMYLCLFVCVHLASEAWDNRQLKTRERGRIEPVHCKTSTAQSGLLGEESLYGVTAQAGNKGCTEAPAVTIRSCKMPSEE